jgi:hypothetical protein
VNVRPLAGNPKDKNVGGVWAHAGPAHGAERVGQCTAGARGRGAGRTQDQHEREVAGPQVFQREEAKATAVGAPSRGQARGTAVGAPSRGQESGTQRAG